MSLPDSYIKAADTLRDRILALIPDNPQILDMMNPWHLFGVEGFTTDGLEPSLAQAGAALEAAKALYRTQSGGDA
jgi:hypothetical protein